MTIRLAVQNIVARENLRRANRGERPLTQQEIANGSGISQPVVSTLLAGNVRRIDLKTLNGLCNFFGVKPSDLFEYMPD
jgi:DNA-binding Xre family transcriptional regulator